jgi:hypothetical protein
MITGRRPSLSAARPAGSSTAPFIAANTPSPIPVHTGEERSTWCTYSGTIAARTPSAANPSAKFAAAAARYTGFRNAPVSTANAPASRRPIPPAVPAPPPALFAMPSAVPPPAALPAAVPLTLLRSTPRSVTAAMIAGTASSPP